LVTSIIIQGFLIKNLLKYQYNEGDEPILSFKRRKPMSMTVTHTEADVCNFVEALSQLPDDRDNRGKRHALAFVVAGGVLAILSGRSKVSSIFRYIRNRIEWLREVTHHPEASVVSRAHLPRLLARVDWGELNTLIATHCGVQVELRAPHTWVAIDGKTLRGTLASGEKPSVVFAVSHERRTLLAQAPMTGSKTSEIAVVRDVLKESGLEGHKVTLDAPHCNPTTMAQIHHGGGQYVIQVQENQPLLLKQCQDLAATVEPRSRHTESEKGHGRLTTRAGQGFDMSGAHLAARWSDSGIHTLVVMKRQTLSLATQKTTCETAYDLSNQALASEPQAQAQALTGAIRHHWHVESDHWIRDVTFTEDHVKTPSANQAQVMSCLRSLAIRLLRRFNVHNFQEALEDFADCPSKFEALLRRVKFL
jgi:predicted transposase YbfD/YdcC